MIAAGVPRRLSLLSRSLVAAIAAGIGVAVGWTLTTDAVPMAKRFFPIITLISAVLFGAEIARARSRAAPWAVYLCGLLAGRAVYELAMLVTGR